MRAKVAIAGLILVMAVSYLAFAGVKSGWVYYVEVDEFLADPQMQQQRVRLAGRVVDDERYAADGSRLTAAFTVEGEGVAMPVTFTGAVPNTFKKDIEVVLEGRLDEHGVFQADFMLTKCASKYQAEDHANRLGDGS
jgi:cytochrome c-type biogenesis protein CcmE